MWLRDTSVPSYNLQPRFVTREKRSTDYQLQRISIAIKTCNASCIRATLKNNRLDENKWSVHIRYVKGLLSIYLIEYSNKNVSQMLHKTRKTHGVVGAELNCNFVGILFSTWLLLNICFYCFVVHCKPLMSWFCLFIVFFYHWFHSSGAEGASMAWFELSTFQLIVKNCQWTVLNSFASSK